MRATSARSGEGEWSCSDEVDRRIRRLLRMKELCGALSPARDRRFHAALETARTGAASPIVSTRASALVALEMLGLELCDN